MPKNLEDVSLTQLNPIPANARLFAQVPGDNTDYYADVGDPPQPPAAAGAAGRVNVDSFAGGSFQAKLQNGLDAGEPIQLNPGLHTLDSGPLAIPTGGMNVKGAGDGLRGPGTTIRGDQGADIFFRSYTNAAQARPAGQNQVTISELGFRLRPNGANTRSNFERCTTTGYGVGICAIAYERGDWPTERVSAPLPQDRLRTINEAWNTSHSHIYHVTCDVENGAGLEHGCGVFHSQGNTYGSRFMNMDSGGGQSSTRRGTQSLVTIANPYVHRVTADPGSDRINTSGPNEFINDQEVMIRAHDSTGSRPGGIGFNTEYFVVNRTGTSFQLATSVGGSPINITSAGSGFLYALLIGQAGAEFAPDEVVIQNCSHYNPLLGVSVANPERLEISNLTSYSSETILEVPGFRSNNRTRGVTVDLFNIYSESPQAAPGNPNSECILIDTDELGVMGLQFRGADLGVRPIYRFAGIDHTILNLAGRSSLAQNQPDISAPGVEPAISSRMVFDR